MENLAEVKTDYIDEELNLNYIDGYLTADDNEQGFTVAVVDRDTAKVIWFRNEYRYDNLAVEAIEEVLKDISKNQVIYVGIVSHKHGINYYASKSLKGLENCIADYCKQWWDEWPELEKIKIPKEDHQIIETYFHAQSEHYDAEWYQWEETILTE